jgi:hypothetical protein
MNTRKFLIGSGVSVAVLAGGVFAWSALSPTGPSYAAGVVARQADFGGHGGWHGGHGRGHKRGMRMICSDRRNQSVENGLAFVEGFVNFTPEQEPAWKELAQSVRAGSATIGKKCEDLKDSQAPQSAPDKLAQFETMATTGLGILQQIRPAFDRFYRALSDKQKKAIDNAISHRGKRHWK